jgi:hypothetical protein
MKPQIVHGLKRLRDEGRDSWFDLNDNQIQYIASEIARAAHEYHLEWEEGEKRRLAEYERRERAKKG